MITLDEVTVWYGSSATAALRDASLEVGAGGHVVVTGPLGAGASTLLRLLNGVVPQLTSARVVGTVRVAGLDPRLTPVHEMARRVGLVLDEPGLAATQATAAEEVAFGLESLGVPSAAMRPRVAAALDEVGLSGLSDRDPATLSGGELQRLAIASVLVMEPALLVLDEPSTNLDPGGRAAVEEILRHLVRERGVTVVRADRDTDATAIGVTTVVRLDGGRLVWAGVPGAAWRTDAASGSLVSRTPATARPTGDPVLVADGVTVTYPAARQPAVDGVSLSVRAGEVVGICGPNGGGKSTVARLVTGLMRPDRGRVTVGGLDIGRRLAPQALAAAAGLVFQDPRQQLFAASVRDELALGLHARRLPDAEVSARVEAAAERFELGGVLDQHPLRLGPARRKTVALAAVCAMRPSLLVLDEPTTGADEHLRALVVREIDRAAREGTAILVLSHDLRLLAAVADRLLVVMDGRVIGEGGAADVLGNERLLETASLRPGARP